MTRERHVWPAETRAEAVGLAMSVGVKEAGRRLGVPYRTISHWMGRPDVQAMIVRSQDDVAARLWEAITIGTDAVLEGLRDPKAGLGDKASALRIVMESHALLSGRATANVNVQTGSARVIPYGEISDKEAMDMRGVIRAELAARTIEEIRAGAIPPATDIIDLIGVLEKRIRDREKELSDGLG